MKSLLHKSFLYKRCAFNFKLLHLRCQSEDDNVKNAKLTFDILKQGSNSQVSTNVSNTQGLLVGGGMLKFSIDQHIRLYCIFCNCIVICLHTEHYGVHMNSLKGVRAFQIELEFGNVGF